MNINLEKNENNNNQILNNSVKVNKEIDNNDFILEDDKTKKEKEKENQLLLEKETKNLILSSIFFQKYKPTNLIGQGSFSYIYESQNIITGEKVAIKLEEKRKNEPELLKTEACYLYLLRNEPGIVKIISFGVSKKFNVLVEPLLGKNLYALFLANDKYFTLKDICLIAIQCINRLESVHSKGIIHCDIKPENFVIGSKDKRLIYLLDFGLSKKYRSDRTKNHIQFSITKTMTGTARYASINALSGLQLSRRDDLESLSYIILYFLTKRLPWQGIEAKTLAKRYKKIYNKKIELEKWEKFSQIPIEIQDFIKYCRSLKFTQEPNYKKMRNYFYDLMKRQNIENDGNFSWIVDKSIIGSKLPTEFQRQKYSSIFSFYAKLSKSTICFNKNKFEKKKEIKRDNSPIINTKRLNLNNINNINENSNENEQDSNWMKRKYNDELEKSNQ